MRDGKIVQIVPAEAGWSAVLPVDGVDRVRFAPVACWAIVEGSTGSREVVPLVGGPSRALATPDPEALGIAGPGESAADWKERLPRREGPPPDPPPAPAAPERADIPGADVLDD